MERGTPPWVYFNCQSKGSVMAKSNQDGLAVLSAGALIVAIVFVCLFMANQ